MTCISAFFGIYFDQFYKRYGGEPNSETKKVMVWCGFLILAFQRSPSPPPLRTSPAWCSNSMYSSGLQV